MKVNIISGLLDENDRYGFGVVTNELLQFPFDALSVGFRNGVFDDELADFGILDGSDQIWFRFWCGCQHSWILCISGRIGISGCSSFRII
ncbi:MAG: hypothetical protein HOI21_07245 [Bacteroidetes Order II. Incertae sedis bacterium]|nr:hypothetical protein [Bacteroidetes Order II. bacterium]